MRGNPDLLGVLGEGVKTNRHKNVQWLEPRGICSRQMGINAEAGTQALEGWSFLPTTDWGCLLMRSAAGGRAGAVSPSGAFFLLRVCWLIPGKSPQLAQGEQALLINLWASVNLHSAPHSQHFRCRHGFQNSMILLVMTQGSKFTQWLPQPHTTTHMRTQGISETISLTFISHLCLSRSVDR